MPTIYADGTYATKNPTWHTEHSIWKAGQILKGIELAALRPRTVAEIGCGAGAILASLKEYIPAKYYGFDISDHAIGLARANQGIDFTVGGISGEYDLVLAIDVIEHVEDVFGFLRELRRHGRSFIFHIPLDMNCYSLLRGFIMMNRKGVGHIHYFSKDTALATLEDCGYTIKNWFYTPVVDVHPGFSASFRKVLFPLSPDWVVKVLGVYSLIVVAQ